MQCYYLISIRGCAEGLAKDVTSAIKYLIKYQYITEETDCYNHFIDNWESIKDILIHYPQLTLEDFLLNLILTDAFNSCFNESVLITPVTNFEDGVATFNI